MSKSNRKSPENRDAERIAARVQALVADAPPLTPELADELRSLLLAENVNSARGKSRGSAPTADWIFDTTTVQYGYDKVNPHLLGGPWGPNRGSRKPLLSRPDRAKPLRYRVNPQHDAPIGDASAASPLKSLPEVTPL